MRRETTIRGVQVLVAAALFAVGCTESIGPERRGLAAPTFDATGSGIVLDQVNGSFNEQGDVLVKGFNPTNPHVGDAIVATFLWIDPTLMHTNIITSVTDRLTNAEQTPVGNTYTLVEFVSDGLISMATYVATNVQGFPDPNTDDAHVLAVQANLALPVEDGGVMISAWTGVDPTLAGALGEHRSASGTGSSYPTVADPGPVAVEAGALAFAITSSNSVVGRDPPPGFGVFVEQSDAFLVDEADTATQATAGTVEPRWNWIFTTPSTWLASVFSLNPAGPATGDLTVTTTTTGSNLDADGYTVTVDESQSQTIATNGSVTFSALAAGSHSVMLSDVAANCTVSDPNPQSVTVPSGGTATASFAVSCVAVAASGKMTGGGKLGDKRDFATFGFEAKPTGGKFEWVQHCLDGVDSGSATCAYGDFTFKGTITPGSYSLVSGQPSCRTWSGTGMLKDKDVPSASGTYSFTMNAACDNGEPGRGRDYIDVTIADYHASGYLSGGNIQLHKSK